MSFPFRDRVRDLVAVVLRGEDGTGGLEAQLREGSVEDYAAYRELVGTIKGLDIALNLLNEAMKESTGEPLP